MKRAAFDRFCAALPGTSFVVQWGGSHVHKVGAKLFAVAMDLDGIGFTFKATPLSFEFLRAQGAAIRAPYLPRGHWLRVTETALPDRELRDLLRQSHALAAASLTKAERRELGL